MTEPIPRKRAGSVLEWLDPQTAREKRQRIPMSCEWITKEAAYKNWATASAKPPVLWIHGPPGCGKSFLAQHIVDKLEQTSEQPVVVSYFCDEYSSPDSIMRSILAQLFEQPKFKSAARLEIAKELEGLLEVPTRTTNTTYKLWDNLSAVSKLAPSFYLIIDGLDELSDREAGVADFNFPARLLEIASYETERIKLLVSSRRVPNLRGIFHAYPDIQVTAEKVQEDLKDFIATEVEQYETLRGCRKDIIATLPEQSDGIFLWAGLSIKVLSLETTRETLLNKLESLPISVDDVFARILNQTTRGLSDQDILLRNSILSWLITAVRPLRPNELANSMALEADDAAFSPETLFSDFEGKAFDVCASLIKLENGVLKALHPSLREYLRSEEGGRKTIAELGVEEANFQIARTCLAFLSQPDFANLPRELSDIDGILASFPFLEYATLYWPLHLSRATKAEPELKALLETFFKSPNAFVWVDRLIPFFLSRSVLPVPPRPSNSARFAYLFVNKSYIVDFFEGSEKILFDRQISEFFTSSYEEELEKARVQDGAESIPALQRVIDLVEIYGWLPGKSDKAQDLLEQAIEMSSKLKSLDHQDMTIALYQALSDIYKRQGRYKEAQELLGTLLDRAKNQIPPTDARLMFALDSLGWVYMRLEKLYESAGILQQALDIAAAQYGSSSPITLRSKVTLAEVLGKLGRAREAELLCTELKSLVQGAREKGRSLPRDSISQMNTLAAVYVQQRKFKEAEETYEMVVEDRQKMFGADHPITLWATMQLAKAKESGGSLENASALFSALFPRQEKALGGSHPDTKETLRRLESLRSKLD